MSYVAPPVEAIVNWNPVFAYFDSYIPWIPKNMSVVKAGVKGAV